MIIDPSRHSPRPAQRSDVLVIGSGAAGIPIALDLVDAGLSVVMVESGGRRPTSFATDLSKGVIVSAGHAPLDRYRTRALGGTTRVWGGRVAPLDAIDFESRDWVPNSGWPIGPSDLTSYYRRAHDYLMAGPFEYSAARSVVPRPGQEESTIELPSFHDQMLWRFSEPVDLGKRHRGRLRRAASLYVLTNTTAIRLILDDDNDLATGVELAGQDGRRFYASARTIVVAAGGLESTRLLLTSATERHPTGLGNRSGALGRYYMSHLAGTLGPFSWLSAKRLPGEGYDRDHDGTYLKRTLSLEAERQRQDGLLNFRAAINIPAISDPRHGSSVLSSAYLAKRFVLRRIPPEFDAKFAHDGGVGAVRRAHQLNVVRGLPELAKFLPWWIAKRTVPRRKIPSMEAGSGGSFYLHFDAEQSPAAESTVFLDESVDALGVPRLRVDWKVRPADVESLARSFALLDCEFRTAGVAACDESREAAKVRIEAELGVGSHHIGTTRMATSREHGVVDSQCRVHGVPNLLVASSSTFPTAGVANPTLTITALALRVADAVVKAQVPITIRNTR